jgi:hypothetical protein
MNDKQIIRAAIKRKGESQAGLATKIGYKNKTSIATMLSRPTELRLGVIFKMLDALGYDIVVRSRDTRDEMEFVFADNEDAIETVTYIPEAHECVMVQPVELDKKLSGGIVPLPKSFTSDHVRDARLSDLMAEGGEVTAEE